MIVVADTAPLNYLILLDCDSLLPKLYGRIVVPAMVIQELVQTAAPAPVRRWIANVAVWIEVRLVAAAPDADLADLDRGSGKRFSSKKSNMRTCY